MKQLLVLSLLITLSACSKISSDEVEASSIYGELSVSREEGSSNATASARFFVGGSTGTMVNMVSPAKVVINGQEANEVNEPIIGTVSYQRSIPANGNASIVYTDKEGGVYTNTLTIPGSTSMSVSANTVFKSTGFVISYSSTSNFVNGESLEVYMSGSNYSTYQHFSLVTGAASGNATINASDLTNFTAGTLTVQVCREAHPSAQAPFPKGTYVTLKSCANSKTVNLQL